MWRFKTVTKFKKSFFPGLIYWNHNRIHLGFWESWFGPPPIVERPRQVQPLEDHQAGNDHSRGPIWPVCTVDQDSWTLPRFRLTAQGGFVDEVSSLVEDSRYPGVPSKVGHIEVAVDELPRVKVLNIIRHIDNVSHPVLSELISVARVLSGAQEKLHLSALSWCWTIRRWKRTPDPTRPDFSACYCASPCQCQLHFWQGLEAYKTRPASGNTASMTR